MDEVDFTTLDGGIVAVDRDQMDANTHWPEREGASFCEQCCTRGFVFKADGIIIAEKCACVSDWVREQSIRQKCANIFNANMPARFLKEIDPRSYDSSLNTWVENLLSKRDADRLLFLYGDCGTGKTQIAVYLLMTILRDHSDDLNGLRYHQKVCKFGKGGITLNYYVLGRYRYVEKDHGRRICVNSLLG